MRRKAPLSQELARAAASLALIAGAALAAAPTAVLAQATESRRGVAIAAGPLSQALNAYASAAGVELTMDASLLQGKRSAGLSGSYTVEEGFAELLRGQGLRAAREANGSYTLKPAPPQDAALLEPVTVTGAQAETAAGPFPGYAARLSATGTKTDTLIETPQSITVIGAQEIETLKSQSMQDALGYVAGVSRAEGIDRTTDSLFLRGFRSNQGSYYRDGSLYTVNIYNGRQEPYGLERIEFLKGASSVLYGAMPPAVSSTRSASVRPSSAARAQCGSGQLPSPAGVRRLRRRAGSGWHLVLSPDRAQARQRYLRRLCARRPDLRRAGHQVAAERGDLADIAGRIPARPDGLRLWPAGAGHGAAEPQRPHPAQPVHRRTRTGRVQDEALFGRLPVRTCVHQPVEAAAQPALHQREERLWIHRSLATDAGRAAHRGPRFLPRVDRSSAVSTDTSLQYQTRTGIVEHTLLAGLDYSTPKHETRRYFQTLDNLDLYDPVYGSPLGPVTPNINSSTKSDTKRLGIYLQDQMKIADKWVVLLGGRQDWVRANEHNLFTGEQYAQDRRPRPSPAAPAWSTWPTTAWRRSSATASPSSRPPARTARAAASNPPKASNTKPACATSRRAPTPCCRPPCTS